MAERTPVRDHVLKMIAHLNELEILGVEIDGESQVDIVLMSLPESFNNFHLNYSMSKGSYSLAELLKELQAAKGILGHVKSVQVVEKGSYSSSTKRNKKKKKAPKPGACSKQKSKASPKVSASHVVSEVIGSRIALSSKLVLKTANLKVYLFV